MSIEEKISALIAALEANTAAHLKSAKSGGSSSSTASTATTSSGSYKAKHDKESMMAQMSKVKETLGVPAARSIVKEFGKAEKMAEITDPKLIDAVYEEASRVLAEHEKNDDM